MLILGYSIVSKNLPVLVHHEGDNDIYVTRNFSYDIQFPGFLLHIKWNTLYIWYHVICVELYLNYTVEKICSNLHSYFKLNKIHSERRIVILLWLIMVRPCDFATCGSESYPYWRLYNSRVTHIATICIGLMEYLIMKWVEDKTTFGRPRMAHMWANVGVILLWSSPVLLRWELSRSGTIRLRGFLWSPWKAAKKCAGSGRRWCRQSSWLLARQLSGMTSLISAAMAKTWR